MLCTFRAALRTARPCVRRSDSYPILRDTAGQGVRVTAAARRVTSVSANRHLTAARGRAGAAAAAGNGITLLLNIIAL